MLNEKVDVHRYSDDFLKTQVWNFTLTDDLTLVLNYYAELSKPTKRHHFRVDKHFSRLDRRTNTIEIGDIELPKDVADEALDIIKRRIRVTKE